LGRGATNRVKTEIALGFDMRSRPAVANTIECALGQALARKWLGRRSAVRLADEATRVLNLDVATAVAIHYAALVIKAKARNTKLDHAVQAFGAKMEEVRGAASSAVASLSKSAEELKALANTASTQSKTVSAAASDAAANVGTMAVAVDQLSTSISNIHGQATRSAEMARRTASQRERTEGDLPSVAGEALVVLDPPVNPDVSAKRSDSVLRFRYYWGVASTQAGLRRASMFAARCRLGSTVAMLAPKRAPYT
jgi:methyl-accepting chemotaxis protein